MNICSTSKNQVRSEYMVPLSYFVMNLSGWMYWEGLKKFRVASIRLQKPKKWLVVRRQTIEIKSVSLQQSLSKLKQRGVDLVKDSTGLEAGLDCRPGRFAAAQGRQSHPASRPVSSLTRSTPLCFSLARLVLRSPFLFYGLSPDHKKVVCVNPTEKYYNFPSKESGQ